MSSKNRSSSSHEAGIVLVTKCMSLERERWKKRYNTDTLTCHDGSPKREEERERFNCLRLLELKGAGSSLPVVFCNEP